MQKRGKRGLSTIIVTLILILVSIVAVGIVWLVVRNIIQTGTEGIGLSQFSLSAKILDVAIDNSSNNISLTVKRNAGKGELEGISFVFLSNADTEVVTKNVSLKELEQANFIFHLNMSVSDLISVSIVPLIRQDEKQITGIALDKYNFGKNQNTPSGQTSCTPVSNPCGTFICGNVANGTCGQVSCGTCGTGYNCVGGSCVSQTFAGNFRYVRAGATGANNGSDWINAYTDLPYGSTGSAGRRYSSFERNVTYYIADGDYNRNGNYPVYIMNVAENGNQYITIKKAIESEHGTNNGWDSNYGDGQAVFNESINFVTGYYIWDGKVGNGVNDNSYGFKIIHNGNCVQVHNLVGMPPMGYISYSLSHVNFSYTAMLLPGFDCGSGVYGQFAIYSMPAFAEHLTISNNLMEGGSSNMLIRSWSNSTIENNYWNNQWSSSNNHGQQISPGSNCDDILFRNNVFYNSTVFVIGMHTDNNQRWKVYNNIILGDNSAFSSVFANADSSTSDVFLDSEFYHNTFINVNCGGRGALFVGTLSDLSDKSYAYNNLFYNSTNCGLNNADGTSGGIVSDYNACFDSNGYQSCNTTNAVNSTGNPFVSLTLPNYKLDSVRGILAINTGKSLNSFFNTDFLGVSRPQGSAWDIGAYEYV